MIDMTREEIEQVEGAELAELTTPQCIILKDCENERNWHDWKCRYIYIPCLMPIY